MTRISMNQNVAKLRRCCQWRARPHPGDHSYPLQLSTEVSHADELAHEVEQLRTSLEPSDVVQIHDDAARGHGDDMRAAVCT